MSRAHCVKKFCMLSDFVHKKLCLGQEDRRGALLSHYLRCTVAAASSESRQNNMGNSNTTCQMSNYSKRNIRVFAREKPLQIDAFITSETEGDDKNWKSLSILPGNKKFSFRKDSECIRVLASQIQEVPWSADLFLSVFVEDEDDENVCSKQIMHNMALSAPVTVLLYDV